MKRLCLILVMKYWGCGKRHCCQLVALFLSKSSMSHMKSVEVGGLLWQFLGY